MQREKEHYTACDISKRKIENNGQSSSFHVSRIMFKELLSSSVSMDLRVNEMCVSFSDQDDQLGSKITKCFSDDNLVVA